MVSNDGYLKLFINASITAVPLFSDILFINTFPLDAGCALCIKERENRVSPAILCQNLSDLDPCNIRPTLDFLSIINPIKSTIVLKHYP